jgi:hypothetical protein
VKVGTSKSTISLQGCGASGAYALGPDEKKKKKKKKNYVHTRLYS